MSTNWTRALRSTAEAQYLMPHSALSNPLTKIQLPISYNLIFTLGDGLSTSFWHHNWGLGILAYTYPELHSFARDDSVCVGQYLAGQAILNFRRSIGTSATAMSQLINLTNSLAQGQSDSVQWRLGPKGYSTASFYRFLKTTPMIRSQTQFIRKICAPPRMSTFTWLLLANRLPTVDNLKLRGLSLPNMCVLCRCHGEDACHIAQECPYTGRVWTCLASLCPIGDPKALWKDKLLNATSLQRAILVISTFLIWRERCNRIFRNAAGTPETIAADTWNEWRVLNTPI